MFLKNEVGSAGSGVASNSEVPRSSSPEVHPSSISTQFIDVSLNDMQRDARRRRDYLVEQRAEIDRELEALHAMYAMFDTAESAMAARTPPVSTYHKQ